MREAVIRSRRPLTAVIALACLVAGCGSGGNEVNADGVNTSILDTGNYPTTPRAPLGDAKDAGQGALVESRRMADYVVLPSQVDPQLTVTGSLQMGIIRTANGLAKQLPAPIGDIPLPDFVAGFNTLADNPGPQTKSLQNFVIRTADPAAAQTAADALAKDSGTIGDGSVPATPTRPIAIPGHPEARAVTATPAITGAPNSIAYVVAFTSHGPYLLAQVALSADGPDAAARIAGSALDLQIPLIDRFQATPVDKVASLPLDPDGLLARTLDAHPDEPFNFKGLYGPHGFVAYSDDSVTELKKLDDAGVDMIAFVGPDVYRTRDADAARRLQDTLAKDLTGPEPDQRFSPSDGVTGMPNAKCLFSAKDAGRYKFPRYNCSTTAGRYLIVAYAGQEKAVHQQLAAAYLMLTAS